MEDTSRKEIYSQLHLKIRQLEKELVDRKLQFSRVIQQITDENVALRRELSAVQDQGFTKNLEDIFPPKIQCAAIKYNKSIYLGTHHGECYINAKKDCVQGFLTTTFRFVDRVEGLEIAEKADQIVKKHPPLNLLLSEDLKECDNVTM